MDEKRTGGSPADDSPGQLSSTLSQPSAPDRLQQRVVASLTERGLLRPRHQRLRTRLLRIAAAAACAALIFVTGMRIGHDQVPLPTPRGAQEYAILLYGDGAGAGAQSVAAHQRWASQLRRDGHTLSGRKLGASATLLRATPAAPDSAAGGTQALTGFFVVTAATETEAIAIARSTPHFASGGTVVVRMVERT
jgi:hypothetical protein